MLMRRAWYNRELMQLVVGGFLVGAALLVAGCRGNDQGQASRKAAEAEAKARAAAEAKKKELKGPFANAVQVNEHGWMMTGDLKPPPVVKESIGIDDDESDTGGGADRG